jgi:hypothetical protein
MARRFHDWTSIQAYYDEGHLFDACAERFGFTRSGWNKAIARGALRLWRMHRRDRRHRYSWIEIQEYYDKGFSYHQTASHFGFCSAAWYNAIARGDIKPRPPGMAIAELLSNSSRNRSHLKMRLLKAELLRNCCDMCGLTEWRGKPLNIHLDHINGVKNDNRLDNLRMLCPNCHSQTPTFAGRNVKRRMPVPVEVMP